MKYELIKLPYEANALEPVISKETLVQPVHIILIECPEVSMLFVTPSLKLSNNIDKAEFIITIVADRFSYWSYYLWYIIHNRSF